MTTERQFAANRQNAKSSTGPKTEEGKRRSRRNALRHGLMAETIIDVLEDPAKYKAFASKINADYRPHSNFERELVARLISLLWRLRRSVAIESGLFAIEGAISRNRVANEEPDKNKLGFLYDLMPSLIPRAADDFDRSKSGSNHAKSTISSSASDIARCFARLAFDSDAFDRLGRYEMRLWRQTIQIILLLNSINQGTNTYTDSDDRYLDLRTMPWKRRRTLWPPFPRSE